MKLSILSVGVCALLLSLAACTSAPSGPVAPASPPIPTVPPEQRFAAVLAAAKGADDDRELAVQPLRDPEVQDLRERAAAAITVRNYAAAADALNQALLLVADDPAVLQERAEVALLQADHERAETLSRRALDLGSRVGPLCRRHWATIEQSRQARGLTQDAVSARAQIEGCTVAGLQRM